MKVIEWTFYDDMGKIPELPNELYEKASDVVTAEIRENGYHFSGEYHQNGEFGCPIIETDDGMKYQFQTTMRSWGALMAEAYPDEEYNCEPEFRYTKWAWMNWENTKFPNGAEFRSIENDLDEIMMEKV